MIRLIDFQCKIEKHNTHEIYSPQVLGFNIIDSLPLTNAPSCTIKIASKKKINDVTAVSQVEFDDIIRLQASIRFNVLEKHVWVDIFEGRVQNISKEFSTKTDIEFSCVGHIAAAFDALIKDDRTYTGLDAKDILASLTTAYTTKLVYNSNYVETGLNVTQYNSKKEQNFLIDAYQEMEKLSGYKRMIGVNPTYTASGRLQTVYLSWKKLPTVPTRQYSVIEGTPRLRSAIFDIVGEDVKNYRYVKGGLDTEGNQYSGSAINSDSISKYGSRYVVDIFSWIQTNTLCREIAAGLTEETGEPYIAGQVTLEGTLDARIGDLVGVMVPSIELSGTEINGNYTVYRVNHVFTGDDFYTVLDLGRIKKSEYDYMFKNFTQIIKTCYKNQVK